MNKWYDYYIKGLDKERLFSQDLIKQEGGEVIKSNKKSDIYDHIDLVWIKDSKNITFDVKAAKKSQRSDLYPDYNIHWIELKNVKGNPGWLFGKSDYIAFECKDFWLCVDRANLISILKNKIDFTSISPNNRDLYTICRRHGRLDAIVKIETNFLYNVKYFIIKKQENYESCS